VWKYVLGKKMKDNLQRAEPCSMPVRGSQRRALDQHIGNMDELSDHFRAELRLLIARYRLWRTSRDICDMKGLYMQADGDALRQYIRQVLRLYREAQRDLQAMRRVGKMRL
jgi:hypothetical protein